MANIRYRYIHSLAALFLIVGMTACRPELQFLPESFQSPDAEISGDEEVVSLVFSSKAGSASLSLQSSEDWKAAFVNDRAREWCSIPSESGQKGTFTLTVAVKENATYDERMAVILLRSKDLQRTVVVTQTQLDALLLSPGDRDIRFNLQIARSKTFDKIVPESEMFFVTWYRSLVSMMSVDGWARTALIALGLTIILLLVYLFSDKLWLRKVGFFGGVALLLVFFAGNLFAWQQKQDLLNRKGAIIFAPAVTVKSTPAANGTDLFILHEGTKVTITDGSMKDWKEIRIADGKEGWIETKLIKVI